MFDRLRLPPGDGEGVVTAFRDGQVTLRENRRSDGFTFATKEIGYQGVREGNLVVHSMDGFAGAIGVSESTGKCSPVYVICDPKPGVDARFQAYVLRHMAVSGYITSLAKGIRERSTSFGWGELKEEWLPLPMLPTQKAIADFLDRKTAAIDSLIAKKQRLLGLLAEKRVALINQTVTKGFDPSVPMKDSGIPWIGAIPAHWEVKRLGYSATIGNGSTPSRTQPEYWSPGEVPWLNSSKINDLDITRAEQFVSTVACRDCHLPMVRPGSLLVAITGEGQTRGRSAHLHISASISQHLAFVTLHTTAMVPEFLLVTFRAAYAWMRHESSGTGSTRAALTCGFLRDMRVPTPPVGEQMRVATWLREQSTRMRTLEAKLVANIERLQEYRQALITAAVTGQLDITEETAP